MLQQYNVVNLHNAKKTAVCGIIGYTSRITSWHTNVLISAFLLTFRSH